MTLRRPLLWTTLAFLGIPRLASAGEPTAPSPIVVQYDAPPECPSAEAFAAAVRAELAGRRWDPAPPLQVHVAISSDERVYTAVITSTGESGVGLDRTLSAPSCGEATDIAAAIIALAQSAKNAPDVIVTRAPGTLPEPAEQPSPLPRPASRVGDFTYSFSLGYGAFSEGPATPVVRDSAEQTTFNAAQGVRLGFGVTHAMGWWKHSLHASAAYYRQSTTTVPLQIATPSPLGTSTTNEVSLDDRDVLLATLDACPVHLDYEFISLMPCATFSMMQTRGTSGNNPGLETGFGGSGRVRATFATFFAEALGTAVAVNSSYDPPSHPLRLFYSLSLGVLFR